MTNKLGSLLKDLPVDEKIDLIQQTNINKLDDESLSFLVSFISHEDKGIRSCVTICLTNSNDKRLPKMLVKYISSSEISTRNLAGEILVNINSGSVDAILDYLNKSENFDDQKFCIDLLGLIKDNRAEEKIIELLESTTDENVKLSCLESLGNLRAHATIDKIIACYNENFLYKPTAIEALGKIGSKKALSFMLEQYPDEDDLTKYSIIEGLGVIGDIDCFFFLISELHNVNGPLTWVILTSVYQLREKYNLDVPFDEKVKSTILNTIYDAQPEFKMAAIHLLKEFNDKEILTACLQSMGYDFELDEILRAKVLENSKQAVLSFPAALKNELKNVEIILGLIDDVIESLDQPIASVLSGLNLRSFIDSLSNYLNHPDEEVRRIAMNLLFKIDPKTAVLFTDKMLSDDNLWNKLRLIENLAEMDGDSSLTLLYKLSKDPEIMVSKRASEIIAEKTSIEN